MRAGAGGGRDALPLALRLLLIATACGLVFALLNLPDFRARAPGTGESPSPARPRTGPAGFGDRRQFDFGARGLSWGLLWCACWGWLADSDGSPLLGVLCACRWGAGARG